MNLDQAKDAISLAIRNNPGIIFLIPAIKTVLDAAGTLQKIPIDYSKAGYPLDGSTVLIFIEDRVLSAIYKYRMGDRGLEYYWTPNNSSPLRYKASSVTHYTPMPEFEEVKGGEV